MSLDTDAPRITLRSASDAKLSSTPFSDGYYSANTTTIYSEADKTRSLGHIQPSSSGKYLFFARGNATASDRENEICRIELASNALQCFQAAPFQYLWTVIPLSDDDLLYVRYDDPSGLATAYTYSFATGRTSQVMNVDRYTHLEDLSR